MSCDPPTTATPPEGHDGHDDGSRSPAAATRAAPGVAKEVGRIPGVIRSGTTGVRPTGIRGRGVHRRTSTSPSIMLQGRRGGDFRVEDVGRKRPLTHRYPARNLPLHPDHTSHPPPRPPGLRHHPVRCPQGSTASCCSSPGFIRCTSGHPFRAFRWSGHLGLAEPHTRIRSTETGTPRPRQMREAHGAASPRRGPPAPRSRERPFRRTGCSSPASSDMSGNRSSVVLPVTTVTPRNPRLPPASATSGPPSFATTMALFQMLALEPTDTTPRCPVEPMVFVPAAQ